MVPPACGAGSALHSRPRNTHAGFLAADYHGRASFGAIRGIALSVQVLAQAAGPLLSGVLRDWSGRYLPSRAGGRVTRRQSAPLPGGRLPTDVTANCILGP